MDKIQKLLKKVPPKDRDRILAAYYDILNRRWEHLDKKNLKEKRVGGSGLENIALNFI